MLDDFSSLAHGIARALEVVGIVVIVLGAAAATVAFLVQVPRERSFGRAYRGFRTHLGRAILLGLEFLVAADIIATVAVEPTFRSLGVLGLLVLIRTFLSFALEVEIDGRWPWQQSPEARAAREQNL